MRKRNRQHAKAPCACGATIYVPQLSGEPNAEALLSQKLLRLLRAHPDAL